ncbi:MAG: hypothetical protein AB7R69_06060 [Candidatus Babeliales bacterium]
MKKNMDIKKNPLTAKEFIEGLVINKNPISRGIGKYIKAFALKYGISELVQCQVDIDRLLMMSG